MNNKTGVTKGLLMVYTGNGKGKTTAALGLALRGAGHGLPTLIIQFLKGDTATGEYQAIKRYLPLVEIVTVGRKDFIGQTGPTPTDFACARRGMDLLATALASGKYHLIILDEINVAVKLGIVCLAELLAVLNRRLPQQHILLTGRDACPELIALADLVSEIQEIKHPYRQGCPAQIGIEF